MVLPRGMTVTARGLHVHGARRTEAVAGERVAVNLGGVEVSELSRGDTLCSPSSVEVTRRFDVAIDLLGSSRPLRHGARVRFHQGTSEIIGRVSVSAPIERRKEGVVPIGTLKSRTRERDTSGSFCVRPHQARGTGRIDARRQVHSSFVLAGRHHWRRRRPGSATPARRGSDRGRRAALQGARRGSRGAVPRCERHRPRTGGRRPSAPRVDLSSRIVRAQADRAVAELCAGGTVVCIGKAWSRVRRSTA